MSENSFHTKKLFLNFSLRIDLLDIQELISFLDFELFCDFFDFANLL